MTKANEWRRWRSGTYFLQNNFFVTLIILFFLDDFEDKDEKVERKSRVVATLSSPKTSEFNEAPFRDNFSTTHCKNENMEELEMMIVISVASGGTLSSL